MIDILVPVLGRPQNARPLIGTIEATTSVNYSLVFICTEGDVPQVEACKKTGGRILFVRGGRAEYPRKINHAFTKTDREFCLLLGDDVEFTENWDTRVLAVAEMSGAGVIGTNDMANESVMAGKFSTHPLVRRRYVMEQGGSLDGPGVVLHEGYDHNYVDLELALLAQSRDQWAYAADCRIIHHHPGLLAKDKDATYRKGFRQFRRDRQLYLKRSKQFSVRSR